MDVGYSYGGPHWEHASIYLPPGLMPPEEFEVTDPETGRRDLFVRLSDRSLACEKVIVRYEGANNTKPVYRGCGNYECHRGPHLGVCQCGSHTDEEARPQRAAEGEAAWTPPMTDKERSTAAQRKLVP